MPDPIAHLGALVGRVRPQRRVGKRLVEILADRAALMQRFSVMDQRRDHAQRIDLQIFRRVMLHFGHVHLMSLIAEILFLQTQPHPARSAGSPAVVKDHHGRLPETSVAAFCLIYRVIREWSMTGVTSAMLRVDSRLAW